MTSMQGYGPPDDVPGECNAWLMLSDNYGDNDCTFRCQLPEGHIGQHEERCRAEGESYKAPEGRNVSVRWDGDDHLMRVWGDWRSHQWSEAGCPDEWDTGTPPEGWDWRPYKKKLDELHPVER